MRAHQTYVWGVVADQSGIIRHRQGWYKEIPGGGVRFGERHLLAHEPASTYASTHAAPMPMRWGHKDEIGRIVALRRNHGQLYAVGETTLEPDELSHLTEKYGDLRWSTATATPAGAPLRITEISLTPKPATVGLPAVSWYKLDVTKGNPPAWVREDLARASKLEFRQRGELQVHDVDLERWSDDDMGSWAPRGRSSGRFIDLNGERVPLEYRIGKILSIR